MPSPSELLRLRALERLGAHGHPLARAALESGALDLVRDVTRWEGSLGTIAGHHAVLSVTADLRAAVEGAPSALDALTAAIAAAIAVEPASSLVGLSLVVAAPRRASSGPYR